MWTPCTTHPIAWLPRGRRYYRCRTACILASESREQTRVCSVTHVQKRASHSPILRAKDGGAPLTTSAPSASLRPEVAKMSPSLSKGFPSEVASGSCSSDWSVCSTRPRALTTRSSSWRSSGTESRSSPRDSSTILSSGVDSFL